MTEQPQEDTPWIHQSDVARIVEEALSRQAQHFQSVIDQRQAPGGTADIASVERAIAEALERQKRDHETELQGLKDQLDSVLASVSGRAITDTTVPEHAAGPGTEKHETWSQWEQELSYRAAELSRADLIASQP